MKNIFRILMVLLAFVPSAGAQDYNLDFENWDTSSLRNDSISYAGFPTMYRPENPYKGRPEGWGYSMDGSARTTDAYSGNYAWVLYQWYGIVPSTGLFNGDRTSYMLTDEVMAHFPEKLYGISGRYKYIPDCDSTGTAYVKINTYKKLTDGTLQLLGSDSTLFAPTNTYDSFLIGTTYTDTTVIPDSVSIRFRTGGPAIAGSTNPQAYYLFLDDLILHFSPPDPAKLIDVRFKKKVEIYPNPSGDLLFCNLDDVKVANAGIILCDAGGKLLRKWILHEGRNQFSIKSLPSGMYLVKVMVNGQLTRAEQIIKK